MMKRPSKPTRLERVCHYALTHPNGISEREMVDDLKMTSGRNEIVKLESILNIDFTREWEKTADGLGKYYRYSIPNYQTAMRIANFHNMKATQRESDGLSVLEMKRLANQFKFKRKPTQEQEAM